MKPIGFVLLLAVLTSSAAFGQRQSAIHSRGMLWETVYNTGEIGRAFDGGGSGITPGYPSMEWPPRSQVTLDRRVYQGQHNSFGGGIWIGSTIDSSGVRVRRYAQCGAVVADANGGVTEVAGVYSFPISLERRENYPVLANGDLNPGYNPNEAEEMIIAKWGTPTGLTITRTSRAWSYPDYDDFIIFEYQLENTGATPVTDIFIAYGNGLCPSMFGNDRKYNQWAEADYRSKDQFARFDLNRWMDYNHDRTGKPDSALFSIWSQPGDRGGLNSPQAAGILPLYYDYAHVADSLHTTTFVSVSDKRIVWDVNGKMKQPYLNRYENANLYPSKVTSWLDPASRKTGPFTGVNDSLYFGNFDSFSGMAGYVRRTWGRNGYWIGRGKPSITLEWTQPAAHGYGFGPFNLPAGESIKMCMAEVVGYGPGTRGDTAYADLGGSIGTASEPGSKIHRIPSWYQAEPSDPYFGGTQPAQMASNYLSNHPLPWYVNSNVISIRDVADRAIQMYRGGQVIKYDTTQFEPAGTPSSGVYQVPIPIPAPAIVVKSTGVAKNEITWGPQVESFTAPRLHGPFKHYEVLRSEDPLGPWKLVDSVSKGDIRYFNAGVYTVLDPGVNIGSSYCYAVVSVDSLGGRSGMTNFTQHVTTSEALKTLGKVWVVPNPLVVTSSLIRGSGTDAGDITDRLQFYGLTKHCTIRIFSYSGQLVNTIEHDEDVMAHNWYQVSRNTQILASGVYFFVVQDKDTGATSHGKFVIIH